ncbi:MAG: type I-E CRISPR-associated protein Cas6/Cse3/CasE [Dehalococcoidia bacterium]
MPDLFLSRLTLNLRSRDTQRLLGDCHAMHRLVMSGFPDVPEGPARQALGVLYRVEERPERHSAQVFIQSAQAPAWAFETRDIGVEGPRSLDPLLAKVAAGARFRFRLRANPTRRVHERSAQGPEAREQASAVGKRVPLRREDDRLAWLARKGEDAGFALLTVTVSGGVDAESRTSASASNARADPGERLRGRQGFEGGVRNLDFESCLFEGVLEVRDSGRLAAAVRAGVGPAKAFGMGLLSLAPV